MRLAITAVAFLAATGSAFAQQPAHPCNTYITMYVYDQRFELILAPGMTSDQAPRRLDAETLPICPVEAFDCPKEGATTYGHEEILAIANRRASGCSGHTPGMESAGADKDSACRACGTDVNDRPDIGRFRRADRVATVSRIPIFTERRRNRETLQELQPQERKYVPFASI